LLDLLDVGMGNLASLIFPAKDLEKQGDILSARRIEGDPARIILGAPVKRPPACVMIGAVEDEAAIVGGFLPFVSGHGRACGMICVTAA